MKPEQLKKTTNPFTFYRVEWLGVFDNTNREVFLTYEDAHELAIHLRIVKKINFVHIYEVTEKLL